jgi:hypothetical protein
MDIDSTAPEVTGSSDAEVTQQAALMEELVSLVERVGAAPNNLRLARRQIDVLLQLGLVDEAVSAAEVLRELSFLGESKLIS